ncbi:hypothetical protein HZS_7464, partial [Henneguya salminicola]
MSAKKIYIYETEKDRKFTNLVKERLKLYDINFEILDSLVAVNTEETKILIVETFDLDIIERISLMFSYVYSAKYAVYCFDNELPLPKINFPIYSLCLNDKMICCTDLSKKERLKICNIVKFTGGKFSKDLTSLVTHIVAGKVGSKKYIIAKKYNIPIIKPSWIYDIWEINLHSAYINVDPPNIEKYLCGCFYGLTICVTGFTVGIREKLKKDIISNEGNYSPALALNSCDVLVVDDMTLGKKKTMAAKRWKIPCVSYFWVQKSVTDDQCHDISQYILQNLDYESPLVIDQTLLDRSKLHISTHNTFSEYEKENLHPCAEIFKDLKIFVSNRYEDAQRFGLLAMIEHLGGQICHSIEGITHFITDFSDDLELIPFNSTALCSSWITQCYKNQQFFPEDNFYFTGENIVDFAHPVNNFSIQGLDLDFSLDQLDFNVDRISKVESLQKQFDDLKQPINKPNIFGISNLENVFEKYNISNVKTDTEINIVSDFNPSGNLPPTQSQMILYDDPIGRNEREKLFSTLHHGNTKKIEKQKEANPFKSPFAIKNKQEAIASLPNSSISSYMPSDIYIQLSSFEDTIKAYYSKLIQKLGGNILEYDIYNPKCTHTIVGKFVRSEKLLCSLAAGKWILRESYLKESEILGSFTCEYPHEWGLELNPTNLSLSCARWRENKNNTGFGAFINWKVILFMKPQRLEQYNRVLSAGEAILHDYKNISNIQSSITHIIIDKNTTLTKKQLQEFNLITSNIYDVEFILKYLTGENLTTLNNY